MTRTVIGIGGNVGDVAQAFREALAELDRSEGVDVIAASSLYRTAPVGGVEQDDFLNAAALLEVTLGPVQLLQLLLATEHGHGRTRGVHWGPRTLDLDLLWYEGVVLAAPGLIVPHPRLHERRFALQPLVEVAPFAADANGVDYAAILAGLPLDGVIVVGDPSLVYDPS
jgi:2-amino-4-hydroxy-6-hydroxymethyldihydropteridine diphosphokinase